MFLAVIVLDVGVLNLLGLLVPLAVGVLAKSSASSTIKALLNLGLSAVTGALASYVQAKNGVDLGVFVQGIALTWGISILSYYGLYRPTGTAQTVQAKTASFGIGTQKLTATQLPKDVFDDPSAVEHHDQSPDHRPPA